MVAMLKKDLGVQSINRETVAIIQVRADGGSDQGGAQVPDIF